MLSILKYECSNAKRSVSILRKNLPLSQQTTISGFYKTFLVIFDSRLRSLSYTDLIMISDAKNQLTQGLEWIQLPNLKCDYAKISHIGVYCNSNTSVLTLYAWEVLTAARALEAQNSQ